MAKKINLDESGDLRKLVEEFSNIESEADLRRMNDEASEEEMIRTGKAKRPLPLSYAIGGIGLAVVVFGLIMLFAYRHAATSPTALKAVPNVMGMVETDAREAIGNAGLRVIVLYDEASTAKAGTVVLQRPAPGTRLAADNPVKITVAGTAPSASTKPRAANAEEQPGTAEDETAEAQPAAEQVEIPDVEGLVDSKAVAKLEEMGFRVETVTGNDHKLPEQVVISSDPKPASMVNKGSTVKLTINKPSEDVPPAAVPPITLDDYSGMAAQDALDDLAAKGLTTSWQTEESDSVDSGYVLRTEPAAGSQVQHDGPVTVIVAK